MEWIVLVFIAGLAGLLYYRQSLLIPVKIETSPDTLYQTWSDIPYNIGQPGQEGFWNRAVLVVTTTEIRLQTKYEKAVRFNAALEELRGFWWRDGVVWLHTHIGSEWYVLKLRPSDRKQTLKALLQVTAQSKLPMLEPILYPAMQHTSEVALYFAPNTLVVNKHGLVQHTIDMQSISSVQADDNCLSFTAGEQHWTFTLPTAVQWANALQQTAQHVQH